nr:sperm mitochondrial-associated cysteine-rich protein [Aedes albopictus]
MVSLQYCVFAAFTIFAFSCVYSTNAEKCGRHEMLIPHQPECERTCTNQCPLRSKRLVPITRPTCVCLPGYVRRNGECVPISYCDVPQPACPPKPCPTTPAPCPTTPPPPCPTTTPPPCPTTTPAPCPPKTTPCPAPPKPKPCGCKTTCKPCQGCNSPCKLNVSAMRIH